MFRTFMEKRDYDGAFLAKKVNGHFYLLPKNFTLTMILVLQQKLEINVE